MIIRIHPCPKSNFLYNELTGTLRFQEDLPNRPHEPLAMGSPQENEPPPLPDRPSAPLLLRKTNGTPAIPSLAALHIATPTPPLPLSFQADGLIAPNPEPRPFVPENFGPLDSPPDDRVQRSRGIQSGLSGHNQPSSHFPSSVKSIQKQRPPYPMGSFSGTECWRKTFRDSQAQRLRSARSFRFPDQVGDRLRESNGGGFSGC